MEAEGDITVILYNIKLQHFLILPEATTPPYETTRPYPTSQPYVTSQPLETSYHSTTTLPSGTTPPSVITRSQETTPMTAQPIPRITLNLYTGPFTLTKPAIVMEQLTLVKLRITTT